MAVKTVRASSKTQARPSNLTFVTDESDKTFGGQLAYRLYGLTEEIKIVEGKE